MYFITEKTSETGKKFLDLINRAQSCIDYQKEMSKKYGFNRWKKEYWAVCGGFSSVLFPEGVEIDKNLWKKVRENEYIPDLNSKEGKAIQEDFDKCPKVTMSDINMCIGWETNIYDRCIGYDINNEMYVGITGDKDWIKQINMPKDCKKITSKEFKKLFNK